MHPTTRSPTSFIYYVHKLSIDVRSRGSYRLPKSLDFVHIQLQPSIADGRGLSCHK
jgi:hypothetical protein